MKTRRSLRHLWAWLALASCCAGDCGGNNASTGPTLNETNTPTERILLEGSLSVPQTFFADLNAGSVSRGIVPSSDVWFEVETDTLRYLVPVHNAMLARAGTSAPGKTGCSSLTLSIGGINLDQLPIGTYVCTKTTSGRFSQLQITGDPGSSSGILTLDFITYES